MRGAFFMGALFFLCAKTIAAPLERVLDVSVNVVVNSASSQLEIIAPRTDFLVVYISSLGTFQPLDIPFTVRNLDGTHHNYELILAQLTGHCSVAGGAVTQFIPSTRLDGQPFDALLAGHGVANPQQKHVLTLTFPEIPQVMVSQACEGVAAVIAAVAV